MPGAAAATALVLALAAAIGAGCVHREHRALEAARQDYDSCVAEHAPDHAECLDLEERLRDAQARYERSARRAWGCDPAVEECPTPR